VTDLAAFGAECRHVLARQELNLHTELSKPGSHFVRPLLWCHAQHELHLLQGCAVKKASHVAVWHLLILWQQEAVWLGCLGLVLRSLPELCLCSVQPLVDKLCMYCKVAQHLHTGDTVFHLGVSGGLTRHTAVEVILGLHADKSWCD
jgi:hypothetical protein